MVFLSEIQYRFVSLFAYSNILFIQFVVAVCSI